MADTQIGIEFGGSATGAIEASDETKEAITSIQGATASLGAAFGELAAKGEAAFTAIKVGAAETVTEMREVAESVVAVRESITGLGEAILAALAVDMIAEWVNKMGEAAEANVHTAMTFGLAATQVQYLRAQAALLGIPFQAITTAMQRSDAALTRAREGSKQSGEAFKLLGINIHEPIGQMDLFQKELAGLARQEDVPTRIGMAMQLFGRNIQAIAPLIGVTAAQLDDYNKKIEASGAVSQDATNKGYALAEANHGLNVAFMGLGNVMTSTFAPALTVIVNGIAGLVTAFVKSYNEGGKAKVVMAALADTFKILVEATVLVWDAFDQLIAQTVALYWKVVALCELLSFDLPAAAKAYAKSVDIITAAQDRASRSAAFLHALWADKPPPKAPGADPAATAHNLPDINTTKPKHQEDTLVQQWQTALDQMLIAQNAFSNDSQVEELAFWESKLKTVAAGSKDWMEVQKKVFGLTKQLSQEGLQASIAEAKQQEALDSENASEAEKSGQDILAVKRQALARAVAMHQMSASDELAAEKALSDQGVELAASAAADMLRVKQRELEAEYAALEASGSATAAQIAANLAAQKLLEAQYQDQLTEIYRKGDQDRTKLDDDATAAYTDKWRTAISGVVHSFTSGLLDMAKGSKSFLGVMADVGMTILQGWEKNIDRMIARWAMGQLAQVMATHAGNAAKVASNTTAAATTMAIDGATSLKQILNQAASAAAAAYQSASHIPYIGWLLAPAAAAAVFAGAIAFRGMISSAEGGYDIPSGVNPMTQLHQEEMVLPRSLSSGLKGMISDHSAGGGGGSGGGVGSMSFGDMHYHAANGGIEPDEFISALHTHRDEVAEATAGALRGGWYPPYKQPTGRL